MHRSSSLVLLLLLLHVSIRDSGGFVHAIGGRKDTFHNGLNSYRNWQSRMLRTGGQGAKKTAKVKSRRNSSNSNRRGKDATVAASRGDEDQRAAMFVPMRHSFETKGLSWSRTTDEIINDISNSMVDLLLGSEASPQPNSIIEQFEEAVSATVEDKDSEDDFIYGPEPRRRQQAIRSTSTAVKVKSKYYVWTTGGLEDILSTKKALYDHHAAVVLHAILSSVPSYDVIKNAMLSSFLYSRNTTSTIRESNQLRRRSISKRKPHIRPLHEVFGW